MKKDKCLYLVIRNVQELDLVKYPKRIEIYLHQHRNLTIIENDFVNISFEISFEVFCVY